MPSVGASGQVWAGQFRVESGGPSGQRLADSRRDRPSLLGAAGEGCHTGRMKKLIVGAVLLALWWTAGAALAGESYRTTDKYGATTGRIETQNGSARVTNPYGATRGYARPAGSGSQRLTDKYGATEGYLREGPSGSKRLTDKYGATEGYLREGPSGSKRITDKYGATEGYARPDGSGGYRMTDKYGATTGYIRKQD